MPLNLFFVPKPPAPVAGEGVVTELRLPSASALLSNLSQGATSALRGVELVAAIPRRWLGGRGQSIVEATLGAKLGGRLAACESGA